MLKFMVNHFLRIVVGLIFILSGLAKLFPIEPFELIFVDLGISNWFFAPFIARFIVVFELFLGLTIIFDVWLKNKIYYLAQGSLLFFTFYLVFLLITQGNEVDCGCFGSLIALTPIESIVKNVVLMGMLFFVKRQYYASGLWWLPILFLITSFTTTFLLNRVGLHNLQGTEVNEKIDFSGLPAVYKTNKKVDFSKGKKMVAFLSNACPHCLNASIIFASIGKEQEVENLYYVVGAKTDKSLNEFLDKSASKFPVIWMEDDAFFKYSGGRLPAIVYIEDGVIKKKWFGDLFDVDEVKKYLE